MKKVVILSIVALLALAPARAQVSPNVNYLRSETSRNPQDGVAWYKYANACYLVGDYDEANKALTNAETYLPKKDKANRAQVLRVKSLILMQQKYSSYAMDNINAAIKLDSKNPELYYVRGVFYLQMEDIKSAEKDKKKISSKASSSPYFFMLGGRIAMTQGNHATATQLFTNAILAPTGLDDYQKASIYSLRGNTYLSQYLYQQAVTDFVAALKVRYDQNDYDMLMKAADRYPGASSIVETASLQFKSNPMWYRALGTIYFRQKKYCPQAIEAFQKAAKLDDNVETEINIADCYLQTGHKKCALAVIDAALDKFKNDMALQDMRSEIASSDEVAHPSSACGCEEEKVQQKPAAPVVQESPETTEAKEAYAALVRLLTETQNNPARLGSLSDHDPMANKCMKAVESMEFYKKYCVKGMNGLYSTNEEVRKTTQLFKSVMDIFDSWMFDEVRPIDFSGLIQ